jgi:benzoate-CoA ligase family protein
MAEHNAAAWLVDRHLDAGEGGHPAYIVEGTTTTYDSLEREVWRAQNALRALDVRRGERVALVVNDELAFPALFLGALRSGVVPVPLSTMLTADELAAVIDDSEAGAVVLSADYRSYLDTIIDRASVLRHAVVIGDVEPAKRVQTHVWESFDDRSEAPLTNTRDDSPAFWLYSSGTTGVPKGVMHRHGNMRATAETYAAQILEIGPDDRCLSVAKLFFAYGLGNSLTFPLSVGATTVLNPKRPTPADVAELVKTERPTLFFASPNFLAALLDTDISDGDFASVRCTITAGEALPAEIHRRFTERFGHPVLDGIGSTEALHIFMSNQRGAERAGTSGQPVDGYEARLVDDAGSFIADPDTPGQLQVRGPSLATGYWCRDAATRSAFQGEWLVTGDVYRVSSDGYWTFMGRNSDMIKAGGIWVSPAEVENVLLEHADVLEAAVVAGQTSDGLETVAAFIVPRSGATIDEAAIEEHCRARMAAFKRPRQVLVVSDLPKTATGKVQRFALRQRLVEGE